MDLCLTQHQNEDTTKVLNFKIYKTDKTTHTGCVAARQEEDDLEYASDRGHMRISLAPAIEFVEAQILGHFRVAGKFSLVSRKFLHFGETSPDHALGFISECPCHPCYAHVSAICFDVTTACGYAARCACASFGYADLQPRGGSSIRNLPPCATQEVTQTVGHLARAPRAANTKWTEMWSTWKFRCRASEE